MKNVFQSAILVSLVLFSCSEETDTNGNVTGTVVGFGTADVAASRAGDRGGG
jgi:hypothetical protein